MRRISQICVLLILASCNDAPIAPYVAQPGYVQVSLRPHLAVSGLQSAPVNRIVVTAREVASNQLVGSVDRLVDPTADSWQLTLEVQLNGSAARDIALAIELLNSATSTPTVEWSGTTVVAVAPGQNRQVADVLLYPGALAPIANVSISPTQAALVVGATLLMTATSRDAQGNALARVISWSSSDTSKAVVSSTGVVNGRSTGSAVITARAEGKQATATINVYVPTATSLAKGSGDGQTAAVSTALANAFSVRVLDQNGNGVSGQTVQWVVTSGGGTVTPATTATDASGTAQTRLTLGATAGTQTVEARATGLTGSPIVFTATAVASAQVGSISVAPATRALVSGDTATFAATARDAANNIINNVLFTWTSSDTFVVRVNAAGRVTAYQAGSAIITASAGGKAGSATVTVTGAGAKAIRIDQGNGQSAQAGRKLPFALIVFVGDFSGNPAAGVDITWTVIDGGGSLNVLSARTDSHGFASAEWTLGPTVGLQHVQASASGLFGSPVTFEATAASPQATRKTWIGGSADGPTNWSLAANWSPVGVPSDADTAVIPVTANQPRARNIFVGTLIVQSGAILDDEGYSITVTGSVDVAGAVTGGGELNMTGNNVTVRGNISDLRIRGTARAIGAINNSLELFISQGGDLNVNGQTITTGLLNVGGGTLTMTGTGDQVTVTGSATFANTDERGRLAGGVIRVGGDFSTGFYNDTEFVPTGTLVIMNGNGSTVQRIAMNSSATGNRFKDLNIAAGARVITAMNPLVVERALTLSGILTVESAGVLDVMGPAGSLVLTNGASLINNGIVRANLPITNGGTITGNAVVQR